MSALDDAGLSFLNGWLSPDQAQQLADQFTRLPLGQQMLATQQLQAAQRSGSLPRDAQGVMAVATGAGVSPLTQQQAQGLLPPATAQQVLAGTLNPLAPAQPTMPPAPSAPAGPSLADLGVPAGAQQPQMTLSPEPGPRFTYDPTKPNQGTDLSPEEWTYLNTILGTDAKAAYQRFAQNFTLTYTPVAMPGGLLPAGTPTPSTPMWALGPGATQFGQSATQAQAGPTAQPGAAAAPSAPAAAAPPSAAGQQQYTATPASGRTATSIHDVEGTFTSKGTGVTAGLGPSPREWASYMQTSVYGVASFYVDRMAAVYQDETGQEMPADLRQQLVQAAASAPDEEKRALLAELAGQATVAGATGAGIVAFDPSKGFSVPNFLGDIMAAYEKAHPTPSAQYAAAVARLQPAFRSALGREPTQQEITNLENAGDEVIQRYIDQQTVNLGNGVSMQYGAMSYQQKRLTPLFQQYFGRDPTPQELARFTGTDDQGVQEWIDAQPSPMGHDVKIGRYTALRSFADKFVGAAWNFAPDDGLLLRAHHAATSPAPTGGVQ